MSRRLCIRVYLAVDIQQGCSCITMAKWIPKNRRGGLRKVFDANILRPRPSALTAPGSGDIPTASKGFHFILRTIMPQPPKASFSNDSFSCDTGGQKRSAYVQKSIPIFPNCGHPALRDGQRTSAIPALFQALLPQFQDSMAFRLRFHRTKRAPPTPASH